MFGNNFIRLILLFLFLSFFSNCSSFTKKIENPLTVLIVGDSMIGGYFGYYLNQELNRRDGITSYRFGIKSTGLSEFHISHWAEKSEAYIERYHPDIMLVMFGANDVYALRLPSGALVKYTESAWEELYSQRVCDFLSRTAPSVKILYLIGQPATNHNFFRQRYIQANAIFKRAAKSFDNVIYIPAGKMSSKDGIAYEYMINQAGERGKVKFPDDEIHHSRFGAKVLVELVIECMQKDVNL